LRGDEPFVAEAISVLEGSEKIDFRLDFKFIIHYTHSLIFQLLRLGKILVSL